MHIKNFLHKDLRIDELTTAPDQSWCIFGENNSGIDRLADLLSGNLQGFSTDFSLSLSNWQSSPFMCNRKFMKLKCAMTTAISWIK